MVYGLINNGGMRDVVYEDLADPRVSVGRLFDLAGRPLDPERLRGLVDRAKRARALT